MTAPVNVVADVQAIHQRAKKMFELVNSVHGFDFNATGALAELDTDGTWKYWDAKSPFSLEARFFIAAAPHAIRQLLKDVAALEASNARLQARVDAQAEHPTSAVADGIEMNGDYLRIGQSTDGKVFLANNSYFVWFELEQFNAMLEAQWASTPYDPKAAPQPPAASPDADGGAG